MSVEDCEISASVHTADDDVPADDVEQVYGEGEEEAAPVEKKKQSRAPHVVALIVFLLAAGGNGAAFAGPWITLKLATACYTDIYVFQVCASCLGFQLCLPQTLGASVTGWTYSVTRACFFSLIGGMGLAVAALIFQFLMACGKSPACCGKGHRHSGFIATFIILHAFVMLGTWAFHLGFVYADPDVTLYLGTSNLFPGSGPGWGWACCVGASGLSIMAAVIVLCYKKEAEPRPPAAAVENGAYSEGGSQQPMGSQEDPYGDGAYPRGSGECWEDGQEMEGSAGANWEEDADGAWGTQDDAGGDLGDGEEGGFEEGGDEGFEEGGDEGGEEEF